MRPSYELADIVREYGTRYLKGRKVPAAHLKVLGAIRDCRTSALGGHVERCDDCGEERIAYNSCRNRHCPKCQGARRDRWIEARKADLLDCKYYHVVFTLPEALNLLCLHYPKQMYNSLFAASKETLMQFGRDPKHLGAGLGCISILHTWGQNLSLHPHVHMIVPAGGTNEHGNWVHSRQNGKYLFPVKAMSRVFRGKFMEQFRCFMADDGMAIDEELHCDLYQNEWVVYAKRPFGGAAQVIEYLGRYTHKVAISNHRLIDIANGRVTFSYRDYRDGGKTKTMTIEAVEFLRRFCLHILPRGFRKIRHYGILASRNKGKLRGLQAKMGIVYEPEKSLSPYAGIGGKGYDPKLCPCCKKGRMVVILSFKSRAPPQKIPALRIVSNSF